MLNNNAELDNGVYNEQEEIKEQAAQPESDDLKGLDMQIEVSQDVQNKPEVIQDYADEGRDVS